MVEMKKQELINRWCKRQLRFTTKNPHTTERQFCGVFRIPHLCNSMLCLHLEFKDSGNRNFFLNPETFCGVEKQLCLSFDSFLFYRFCINSSGVTWACRRIPRNVPITNSRCRGTTHPTSPPGVCFFSTT